MYLLDEDGEAESRALAVDLVPGLGKGETFLLSQQHIVNGSSSVCHFFGTYARRKNAAKTTLCEILRHFCGTAKL